MCTVVSNATWIHKNSLPQSSFAEQFHPKFFSHWCAVDKLHLSVRKGLSPFGDILQREYYVASKTHIFRAFFKLCDNIHLFYFNESSRRPIYICTTSPNIVAIIHFLCNGSDFKMHHWLNNIAKKGNMKSTIRSILISETLNMKNVHPRRKEM